MEIFFEITYKYESNSAGWKVKIRNNEWFKGLPVSSLLDVLKDHKNITAVNDVITNKVAKVEKDEHYYYVIFDERRINSQDIKFWDALTAIEKIFFGFLEELLKLYKMQKAAQIFS